MATILGISAFYHDSAACLVVDGEIVSAAQEERFTRRKHDPGFPSLAIDYCLREAGKTRGQIDYVVFYEKPLRKFERLIETYLAFAPSGFRSFRMAMPVWLKEKARLPKVIRDHLGPDVKAPIAFTDHHESHAASAFFPSPFDEAAILTLDGVGEWSTTTWGTGRGNRIELLKQVQFPHSLGLLYSAVTYHCGFKVNSGEYKLMGLAPYGKPVYKDLITRHLIDLKPDGSFWLDMQYFNYCQGLTMTNDRFDALFGAKPRNPETDIEQRHMDMAASIQAVTEDAMLAIGRQVHKETGMKRLVLAGGVALNCVANGRLLREGPFEDIWIQPAAGDAGGALGAALFAWHQLLDKPRRAAAGDTQKGSYLGPRFSTSDVCRFMDSVGAKYRRASSEAELLSQVVDLLEQEKIIGWFQGRMEFGPRALGARSIIGDPRSPKMQANMNLKIKFRESFRPFAPIVLREEAHKWFGLDEKHESPYMLLVAPVLDQHRVPVTDAQKQIMRNDPDLRNRVNVPRSTIPAVTHVDYSARLQTVDDGRNPRLAALLRAFQKRTGCPILVNTSFNVRGEPIVCTPEDAYRCFIGTEMDALVLEDVVLLKEDVAEKLDAATREKYLAQFQLD
ncbi:MAG TPA: carbamoyltransferase [Vicinamibacterales bacterium]|nr:carbamoyltransferase [Vicinamibacterales bacterium]